jgi:fermentation-respiration switch protein FrsA (DUF1100 family)
MKILLPIIILALFFVFYVRFLEKTSVFFPSKEIVSTPENVGLDYLDVYFLSGKDVKLHGWYVKKMEANPTVIFFQGNAGNISDRLEKIFMFHEMGMNVFIFGYRGYGYSEGSSTEETLYQDALAAYEYLVKEEGVDSKSIVLYGASLGGAAAMDLATKSEVAAVIIDSSFTNAGDMAKRIVPFVPKFLLSLKLDNLSKIKEITKPILLIHSQEDQTVPFRFGKQLYEAANQPKTFLEISGGHNDGHIYDQKKFFKGISNFLKENNLL